MWILKYFYILYSLNNDWFAQYINFLNIKIILQTHSYHHELVETWHTILQSLSIPNTREDSTHGHHQMVDTEIRLIIFFAAKDGEALYIQQKQDWELTMAQIMNSLLPNSDWNWRKWRKPLDHSGIT